MKIKREVKIGLFALAMIVALYWAVNWVKGKDLFNRTETYYATYDQVNGIQKSSAIMIKGYKVGVIGNITYDPSRSDKIVLHFNVKSKYKIPQNSQARIYSDGLLGGKAIEIVMGNSERYLHSGDTLHSVADKDILEVAGSELEYVKQKFGTLADNVNATLNNVNKLLEQNTASVNTTFNNLADMSASLNSVVSGEKENIRGIISNLNRLSAVLQQNSDNIENIVTNIEGFSESLAGTDVKAVSDNLTATIAELNNTLSRINGGEGTLGKLVGDEALYNELLAASTNLSELLEDLRKNPGRYVNISVFGRRNK